MLTRGDMGPFRNEKTKKREQQMGKFYVQFTEVHCAEPCAEGPN
jgi:hypothetical protein